jgi:hypothetical protein
VGHALGQWAPVCLLRGSSLSRQSVWWIKLGIEPQRIEAGHPEQNGRLERMHRILKEATALPLTQSGKRQAFFSNFQQAVKPRPFKT